MRVRAPLFVVKLLAALDVILTAPAVAEPMVVVAVPVVLMLVVPAAVMVLPVRSSVPVVLPMVVLPVPVPRLVAAAPEVFMLVVPVTVVAPVMEVVPFVTVKFLPVVTVVSPFRLTAPVPVLNVPLLADWSKLPVPAAKVMFWLAAILTFLFKFI